MKGAHTAQVSVGSLALTGTAVILLITGQNVLALIFAVAAVVILQTYLVFSR